MRSATGDMAVVILLSQIAEYPVWMSFLMGILVYVVAMVKDDR